MQQEWMQHPGIWLSNVLSRPPWPAGSPERRDRPPAASGSGIPYGAVITPCPECCIRCNSAPLQECCVRMAKIMKPDLRRRGIAQCLDGPRQGALERAAEPLRVKVRAFESAEHQGVIASQGQGQ